MGGLFFWEEAEGVEPIKCRCPVDICWHPAGRVPHNYFSKGRKMQIDSRILLQKKAEGVEQIKYENIDTADKGCGWIFIMHIEP